MKHSFVLTSTILFTVVAMMMTSFIPPCRADIVKGSSGTLCLLGVHRATLSLNLYMGAVFNYDFATQNDLGMKFLGGSNVKELLVDVFHPNNSDCGLFVGPGSSGFTTQLQPALPRLQLEYAAGSTVLNEKSQYPEFSRVNPSAGFQGAALADVINAFGIKRFNVLSSPDSFSASIANAISTKAAANGQVVPEFIFLPLHDESQVEALLDRLEMSESKWVAISTSPTTSIFLVIFELMRKRNFFARHQIITSAGFCSNTIDPTVATALEGGLCVDVFADRARQIALESYGQFSGSVQSATLNDLYDSGFPAPLDRSPSVSLNAYAADTIELGLRALKEANRVGIDVTKETTRFYNDVLTKTSLSNGITGPVAINASTNDRIGASLTVVNLQRSVWVPVGTATGNGATFTASHIKWPNNATSIPPETKEEPTVEEDHTALIAILVVLAIIIIVLLIAAAVFAYLKRENRYAPTDESKPITIVFTDIEKSTALWERHPDEMGAVVDTHHLILRRSLADHRGYEVKTIGDSFMVAFDNVQDAIRFGVQVQEQLSACTWPDLVDEVYGVCYNDHNMQFQPFGLRVRIAIHTGLCEVKYDDTTKRYDYYGHAVNTAARVESHALGGQIVITEAVRRALTSLPQDERHQMSGWSLTTLGSYSLKGVTEKIELLECRPTSLGGRIFWGLADALAASKRSDVNGGGDFSPIINFASSTPSITIDKGKDDVTAKHMMTSIPLKRDTGPSAWDVIRRLLSLSHGNHKVNDAIAVITNSWRTSNPRNEMEGLRLAVRRAERAEFAANERSMAASLMEQSEGQRSPTERDNEVSNPLGAPESRSPDRAAEPLRLEGN